MAYDWPGNVRELENAVERAVALGSGPILQVGDLPSNLQYSPWNARRKAMRLCRWKKSSAVPSSAPCGRLAATKLAAARLLGIGKTTLYRKLKQYETERNRPERLAEPSSLA